MAGRLLKIEFVGDVLTAPLARLAAALPEFAVEMAHRDIDQHMQALTGESAAQVLISHARAEYFCTGAAVEQAAQRAQEYCRAVKAYCARNKAFVVVNTVSPPVERVIGVRHVGQLRAVAAVNETLFACALREPLVVLADVAGALLRIGLERAVNLQNALTMRMPYTGHAIPAITAEYARALRERLLPRKKVLVLDADNTLWGGIVGEDGVDGLAVDTQFPGIVHRRFQEQLLALRANGVLLALSSKNNEADVREAFAQLDMPLAWEHFSAVRVDWSPKSAHIAGIAQELNLGLDAIVFIDDNPFELNEVAAALPQVDTYAFDARKPDLALTLLARIRDLGAWAPTGEDAAKARQYAEERERRQAQHGLSLDEYLASLGMTLEVGKNRAAQVKRIAQLTNKTNQFNLTTKRYSEAEILGLLERAAVYDFRLTDRFGDLGIVGVAIVQHGEIDTFLLSCRALGRGVEAAMLHHVCADAGGGLSACYIASAKNGMVERFYDGHGFVAEGGEGGMQRYRQSAGPGPVPAVAIKKVDE